MGGASYVFLVFQNLKTFFPGLFFMLSAILRVQLCPGIIINEIIRVQLVCPVIKPVSPSLTSSRNSSTNNLF